MIGKKCPADEAPIPCTGWQSPHCTDLAEPSPQPRGAAEPRPAYRGARGLWARPDSSSWTLALTLTCPGLWQKPAGHRPPDPATALGTQCPAKWGHRQPRPPPPRCTPTCCTPPCRILSTLQPPTHCTPTHCTPTRCTPTRCTPPCCIPSMLQLPTHCTLNMLHPQHTVPQRTVPTHCTPNDAGLRGQNVDSTSASHLQPPGETSSRFLIHLPPLL